MKEKLPTYTKEEIEQIKKAVVKYEDCGMFLHCKSCIPENVPFGFSAKEYGSYEVATNNIKINTVKAYKSIGIITIWCKSCGKLVWDSRHLQHLY